MRSECFRGSKFSITVPVVVENWPQREVVCHTERIELMPSCVSHVMVANSTFSSEVKRCPDKCTIMAEKRWKSVGDKSRLLGRWSNASQLNCRRQFPGFSPVCRRALSWRGITPSLWRPGRFYLDLSQAFQHVTRLVGANRAFVFQEAHQLHTRRITEECDQHIASVGCHLKLLYPGYAGAFPLVGLIFRRVGVGEIYLQYFFYQRIVFLGFRIEESKYKKWSESGRRGCLNTEDWFKPIFSLFLSWLLRKLKF